MQYRPFGKTNLNLSVFSLGTMRCLDSQQEFQDTIRKAVSIGINHFETARGYGKSEEYLGKTLKQGLPKPRSEIYITTKIPPTSQETEMSRWIEESLDRLQLDYIDCLAIHGLNTWEHLAKVTAENGCLKAIEKAICQGKVRHLGFSTHGSRELIKAAIETDLFEFVFLHYYYFWQHNQPIIELATSRNLGIFIISPTDKGGRLYQPSATLANLCKPLTPIVLNYRFLLSDQRINTLSVGAANPQQLEIAAEIGDQVFPLTTQEKEILLNLETHLENSLKGDRCSQCYQCLPCPESINIPEILRLRNLAIAYDLKEYGQYRYNMLEKAGHWFPGKKGNRCTSCGECLPRCPEKLNIPELLFNTHSLLQEKSRRRLWSE